MAGTITQTGAQLLTNPDVTMPTQSPTLVGSALDFPTPGGFAYNTFLRWDLIDAGTLTAGSPSTNITFSVDLERVVTDLDLFVALWDGTNAVGTYFSDNNNGQYVNRVFTTDAVSSVANAQIPPTGSGGTMFAVGESGDFILSLDLDAASTTVTLSGLGASDSYTTSLLHRTQSLSLILLRDLSSDYYRLNSITVQSELVPEPSSLVLAAFGLAGFVLVASRRRSCRP